MGKASREFEQAQAQIKADQERKQAQDDRAHQEALDQIARKLTGCVAFGSALPGKYGGRVWIVASREKMLSILPKLRAKVSEYNLSRSLEEDLLFHKEFIDVGYWIYLTFSNSTNESDPRNNVAIEVNCATGKDVEWLRKGVRPSVLCTGPVGLRPIWHEGPRFPGNRGTENNGQLAHLRESMERRNELGNMLWMWSGLSAEMIRHILGFVAPIVSPNMDATSRTNNCWAIQLPKSNLQTKAEEKRFHLALLFHRKEDLFAARETIALFNVELDATLLERVREERRLSLPERSVERTRIVLAQRGFGPDDQFTLDRVAKLYEGRCLDGTVRGSSLFVIDKELTIPQVQAARQLFPKVDMFLIDEVSS
jgi:hypothetical protein